MMSDEKSMSTSHGRFRHTLFAYRRTRNYLALVCVFLPKLTRKKLKRSKKKKIS